MLVCIESGFDWESWFNWKKKEEQYKAAWADWYESEFRKYDNNRRTFVSGAFSGMNV